MERGGQARHGPIAATGMAKANVRHEGYGECRLRSTAATDTAKAGRIAVCRPPKPSYIPAPHLQHCVNGQLWKQGDVVEQLLRGFLRDGDHTRRLQSRGRVTTP